MALRHDRRTALVAKELARYNVDIAALSKTHLADKGQLTERSGGYTFFWSGRSSAERREEGVGFAINSNLARKLTKHPESINDRLMTLQLPLANKQSATLISAYAPTMTNPDDIKDKFYEELDALISAIPQSEKLIVLGDFNARVGTDYQTWEGIIGRHGTGKCNNNGLLLLKTCATHDLVITNTLFRLPTRKKTSWMHPRSKHWHLIDYIITRKRDRMDVRVTRAMCGADCWTDHRLIVSKFRLRILPMRRPTEKKQILDQWAEHFNNVLNRPADINDEAIARLPQVEINKNLDTLPTVDEVRKAVKQLSCGKAPGHDAIPAEVYKAGGPVMMQMLTVLFQSMWKKGQVPQQLKDASIVHIYKRKGNRQSRDNHRGISLLSIAGKILARVLLNRLLQHLEQGLLPESQCGFRAERGTVDMIFAARQLQEKCQEQHSDLFVTFVNLTKTFNTVSREGLWKIMEKFGCPSKFITIVRQFHDGMMVKVLDDGDESEAFPVTNGVKQGCVLAPTLFSMVFSAMLTDAFHNYEEGIHIRYRTDGRLFNLRRLQAVT
ncbi:craniofacial development protein 2-like, partial [Mobula hypostoma]|uniref:craniofacial development protein 2-like n=1 Tax=Mobula hypostoma TaxID=723540 RepID=UPI002FC35704